MYRQCSWQLHKKSIFFLLIGCWALFSFQSKENYHRLQNDIQQAICSVDPNVHAGIEIVSLKNGQHLFQQNENHLFVPASNLKIITAAAALHILGSNYRFETKLFTDGKRKRHEIQGNLYIKGSADPELSIRSLEELVFALKLQGIQRITGDLCVDISEFDEITQGPGCMWDEGATYYNSPIGALIVNHSCIDIWVRPNTKIGQAPTIYVRPITDYVKILSDATVSEEENSLKIERRWMNHENTIDITGKIPSTFDPFYTAVPVEAPHLYTANILKDILKKNAISLTGQIRIKTVPEQAVILACTSSRPLCKIVEEMMKESDNLIADMLFKKMGQVRFGAPGTWQKGSRAVREFLKNDVGIDIERIVIMDGSGLSRYNQLSPHHLIEALLWMKKQFACSSEFCASLPISGTDGTLIQRMCESHLKGKIRAKTGTMRGVSSLSGYITTSTGEELVFSILLNGFTKKNTEYKAQIEDRICAILVN